MDLPLSKKQLQYILIFALAFVIRSIFVIQWANTPYFNAPIVDAVEHENWALKILSGKIIGDYPFYQSPAYPYLLALIYKIVGHFPHVIPWLQVLAGSATCVLVAVFSEACFGPFVGFFAGYICVLYRPFIFFTPLLMKETFTLFAFAVFLTMIMRAHYKCRNIDFLWVGLSLGFLALFRSNVLIFFAPLFIFWLITKKSKFKIAAALFVAGLFAPISLATIHNWLASGEFILINHGGGYVFYVGNNESSNGVGNFPHEISSFPTQEQKDFKRIAEVSFGKSLSPTEVSSYWLEKSIKYIKSNPGDWLELLGKRFLIFWNNYEEPDNYNQGFFISQFKTVLNLPLFNFATLSALFIFGLFFGMKTNSEKVLLVVLTLSYVISVILYYVTDRYRLPVVLIMAPVCGLALEQIHILLKQKQYGRLALSAVAAAITFALSFLPQLSDHKPTESTAWAHLANIYHDLGDYEKSSQAISQVLEYLPLVPGSDAFINGGDSYTRLKNYRMAEQVYLVGLQAYPKDPQLYLGMANLAKLINNPKQALAFFKQAKDLSKTGTQIEK